MAKQISLQELIAVNSTPKAKALIVKYGYAPARNINDLLYKLTLLTKEHKEDALKELAEIHPHKDLILNYNKTESTKEERKSNCDGNTTCNCSKKTQYSKVEGDIKETETDKYLKFLPLFLLAGIVSVTLVMATKSN